MEFENLVALCLNPAQVQITDFGFREVTRMFFRVAVNDVCYGVVLKELPILFILLRQRSGRQETGLP